MIQARRMIRMIIYLDPIKKLQRAGYSLYRLRKEKLIGNGTLERIKSGQSVSTETIDTICRLLDCQPGDILEYKKGED